jgi:S-adenosylmethionine/arginine decarboxylase-like enzyme
MQEYFGRSTSIDIIDCNPYIIRDAGLIQKYINVIVELLEMKKYGESNITYFGKEKVSGFSFTQLIETSLISGHFCELKNTGYIDIFSCKEYSCTNASAFTKQYFEATKVFVNTLIRN